MKRNPHKEPHRLPLHASGARRARLARAARLGLLALAGMLAFAGCGGTKLAPGEVAIEVTDEGFTPATAVVPKGKPATLVFVRKVGETCAKSIVFPTIGGKYELPLNQPVRVTLPADRPDTVDYVCGMNMLNGEVVSR